MKSTGRLGAILIHPILFALAFLKGFIFGHSEFLVMSATSAYGAHDRGLSGGMHAVGEVFIVYVMTLGMAPLIITLVGAVLGYLIGLVRVSTK